MTDYLNPDTYEVKCKVTGEILDMHVFIEKVSQNGWEKAFANVVAEYIEAAGDKSAKFLAWIISNREVNNIVLGTQQEMADKSGVSVACVKRVLKKLIDRGLMRVVRSGAYMVTPKMIRHGAKIRGVLMIKAWDDLSETGDLVDELQAKRAKNEAA